MAIGQQSRILKYLNKIKDKFLVFGGVFELWVNANFLTYKVGSYRNLVTSLI